MWTEENKAITRRFFEQCVYGNNPESADELVAEDVVAHGVGTIR